DLNWVRNLFAELIREPAGRRHSSFQLRHSDGTWRWVEAVATNLLHEPSVEAIVINYRDITERKRAEAAVLESESQMRALVTSLDDIVFEFDEEGTYLNVWTSNESLLALPKAEMLRRRIVEMLGEENGRPLAEAVKRVLASGQAENIEYPLEVVGGQRWFQARTSPILTADGHSRTAVMLVRDITRRKQAEQALREAEQQLRLVVNNAPITIFATDAQGVFTLSEGKSLQTVGLKPGENVGVSAFDLYRSLPVVEDTGAVTTGEAVIRRVLAGETITGITELRGVYFQNQFVPLRDANAQVIGLIGVANDITGRKQAEEALKHRLAELEAVNQVSTALRAAQTLDEMLPRLIDATLSVLGTDAGALWLYDEGRDVVSEAVSRGWLGVLTLSPAQRGEGIAGQVLATGEVYLSREFAADPRTRESVRAQVQPGWGGACVPIRSAQGIVGVFFVSVPLPRELTPNEVNLLTTLCEIAGNAIQRTVLHQQTEQRLRHIAALHAIDSAISGSLDLRVTLNVLLDQVRTQLGVDAADVLLFNPGAQMLEYAAGRGFRSNVYSRAQVRLGDGQAGKAALERQIVAHPDFRVNQPSFALPEVMAGEGFAAYYAMPLIAKGEIKGVLEILHRAPLTPDPEWLSFLETLAGQAAIAIENAALFDSLQRSNTELALAYDSTIEGWSRALDLRDRETEGHTRRVTDMTIQLARAFGLGDDDLAQVRWGALLHDIGKMGVPDSILLKPGPLTEDEWVAMKQHPTFAYEMLSPIRYLRLALDIPYRHHEKWDGTGYPMGLKGEQIPLTARIFAVVDVWDALNSDRPYRAAWPEDKVREHLRSLAGTHFDPQVVKVCLESEVLVSHQRE
ncbi:MAG: GAF domain-containing protein, partial [Chloroflexi bacterium]|nr:GAF domain-containing protein [Chloroflexota bacterium]